MPIAPSDLVVNYSNRVFQVRIAALAFSGAVLGAAKFPLGENWQWGWSLVGVVAALGELNSRYTWSYLCACSAAQVEEHGESWRVFRTMHEEKWSVPEVGAPKRRIRIIRRFFLSWGTYLPGLIAGWWLASADGNLISTIGASVSCLALLWWWLSSASTFRAPPISVSERTSS